MLTRQRNPDKMLRAARSLAVYACWSGGLAVAMTVCAAMHLWQGATSAPEWIYVLCVALLHAIFAIWIMQGRRLSAFQRVSVGGRLLTATASASLGLCWLAGIPASGPIPGDLLLLYAAMTVIADAGSALWTGFSLSATAPAPRPGVSFEGKNRLVFAAYIAIIGMWLLVFPNALLTLLYLPSTSFAGFAAAAPGPIHILAVQILVLAAYNVVAARYDLTPLIEAGIYGGSLMAVGFVALALVDLIHPIALVVPAVDVVSIALIVGHRWRVHAAK